MKITQKSCQGLWQFQTVVKSDEAKFLPQCNATEQLLCSLKRYKMVAVVTRFLPLTQDSGAISVQLVSF